MSCCFQAPRQWCWCFRPPILRFLVIFFFTPPTDQKPGNLFDAKRTKRGWSNPYGFFSGFLTILLLRISVYLSFVLFCSFFVDEINWNRNCSKSLYIPFGDSRARIKKWKTRWFIDRKDKGVELELVTALLFTSALSNGPEKQKEKRLWTDYLRLDIKHLLRWHLSPLPAVHGVDSRCWCQFRDALYVAGTCFTRTFPQSATESSATLSTVREMMYFTKTKRSYFRFALPPYPERPLQDRFKRTRTHGPK